MNKTILLILTVASVTFSTYSIMTRDNKIDSLERQNLHLINFTNNTFKYQLNATKVLTSIKDSGRMKSKEFNYVIDSVITYSDSIKIDYRCFQNELIKK